MLEELIRFEALHQKALAAGYAQDPEVAADLKRRIVAKYLQDQMGRLPPPPVTAAEITEYYRPL